MTIDARIPLMAQGLSDKHFDAMRDNANAVFENSRNAKVNAEISRLYDQTGGDYDQMAALGKNFGMSGFLIPEIRRIQSAKAKAALDTQKAQADIFATQGKGTKDFADAGNTTQKTGDARYNSGLSVWRAALQNPKYGKVILNNQLNSGAIDQATFDSFNNQLSVLETAPPEQAQEAISTQIKAMLDPKYEYADANTVANNAQSNANSERTYNASIYGTNVGAQTAANKLEQDQKQFEKNYVFNQQKLYFEQNKPVGFFDDINGYRRAEFADGTSLRVVGEDGQPVKVRSKHAETPEQRMDRIDNTIGSADAARSAARAAQDAAALINHSGLYWGSGATSILGWVPGSDAKAFHAKLENLKSQVFLPTVKALQGMGALSNAEGEKISAAVANLDTSLGPEELQKQLTVLAQQMRDAAKVANRRTQNYASRGGTIKVGQPQDVQLNQSDVSNILGNFGD